ncbi:hypothetical protein NQ314_006425 [Rhamnusium bicolor]|uniref:Uncharacterized protein n=1 Tax=Rhamnusium bicolor TaxID=1586634 RepID=A0AAV8Z393_9CUCU|nr:hypothetical protein NQ314_006425 [Rhamnusium bicolor]
MTAIGNHENELVINELATSSTTKDKLLCEINSRALGLLQKLKNREYSTEQLKLILENIKKAEMISDMESKKEYVREPPNKKI